MATSRRFYKLLAWHYKRIQPKQGEEGYYMRHGMWDQMVHATAEALKEEAPSFDKMRFLEACGVNVGDGR